MQKNPRVQVFSEIAPLKKVMVHRPAKELLNLVPEYLVEMLFDDIPWMEMAQTEHDFFTGLLRTKGVDVIYFRDLVIESIKSHNVKEELISEFLTEAQVYSDARRQMLSEYLNSLNVAEMVDTMIGGIRKGDIPSARVLDFSDYLQNDYPFELAPLPNLYFSRDGFSFVGSGILVSSMSTKARSRENIFVDYILKYHDEYKNIPVYYNRNSDFSIEGGDILVLNSHTLAVGISQRTHANAIERLAQNLFEQDSGFTQILAIDIPKKRTYMHLDTVFTMVDKNVFSVHPNAQGNFKTLLVSKTSQGIDTQIKDMPLSDILKTALGLDEVKLLKCGGSNRIDSAREQWNDGANTLCVAPGEVIVYARNTVTNKLFEENGIKTLQIPCSELSRGRGGPRCMTMPIIREII